MSTVALLRGSLTAQFKRATLVEPAAAPIRFGMPVYKLGTGTGFAPAQALGAEPSGLVPLNAQVTG